MSKKAFIVLSGGLDSSTLAYYLKDKGYDLCAISFDYGQKHKKELLCAKKIADNLGIQHIVIDLTSVGKYLKSSLTTNEEVPEGHYEAENMKSTVVPHRNMIMATITAALAESKNIYTIALGVHGGDHYIYPDCRPDFIDILKYCLKLSSGGEDIEILTPFLHIDKRAILSIGLSLKVPYQDTWTCYNGREKACGKCGSCQERLESFEKCNSTDPLQYE